MTTIDRCRRTIGEQDFLIGSVWEGTGDELHTNRHAARLSMFGQRVLSGISGMLIAVHATDADLLWRSPSTVEWSFDAPLFEGARLDVACEPADDGELRFVVESDGVRRGRGTLTPGADVIAAAVQGRRTRGRTMTRADVELMQLWLPPTSDVDAALVPWPLLVLTTSGLVVRDKAPGEFELVLNRWLRWTTLAPAPVDDTLHCVVSAVARRPSASKASLDVVSFTVDVVSSVSGTRIGHVDWVMMCR